MRWEVTLGRFFFLFFSISMACIYLFFGVGAWVLQTKSKDFCV